MHLLRAYYERKPENTAGEGRDYLFSKFNCLRKLIGSLSTQQLGHCSVKTVLHLFSCD